jgi:hypothetical protein
MNPIQLTLTIIGIIGGLISLINSLAKQHKRAVQVSAILMIVVGVIVIAGHIAKDRLLYQIPADQIGMSLLSAIFFIICGVLFLVNSFHINYKK